MPDDLSEAQKQEAERQTEEQKKEQARQDKAAKDEADRLQKIRDDENRRIEQLAKQNAEQITARAEQMRQEYALLHTDMVRRAQFDSHNAELYRRAEEQKRKEEIERQARLEEKAKEGPIRDASARYNQALGQHYDLRDPYASLAKSAMAEYAAFNRDREAYDQKIAKTADPIERQALDLRKRIEGAEYLSLTGDRLAKMSEIITGRLNSQEAVKERQKATQLPHRGPGFAPAASRVATGEGSGQRPRARAHRGEGGAGDRAAARDPRSPTSTPHSCTRTHANRAQEQQTARRLEPPRLAAGERARTQPKARPGTIGRPGVAGQPGRNETKPPQISGRIGQTSPRRTPDSLFRQVGWLLTACNLPAFLRTLWRLNAREITEPRSTAQEAA